MYGSCWVVFEMRGRAIKKKKKSDSNRSNGHQYFNKEASERVPNVLVLSIEKVLGAFLEELERCFEFFDWHHLDAEELHAHQKRDDALGRVWRRLAALQLLRGDKGC